MSQQFFRDNYETLKRWALRITRFNHDLAEDLVHDVYLKFSEKVAGADKVESQKAYLYVALKNAYITHLRRSAKNVISLSDDNFVETGSMGFDPTRGILVEDELRAICDYACSRKSTSISASIVILRFFHGYFPGEVARILNRSMNSIESRLRVARQEARRYISNAKFDLDNPGHSAHETFEPFPEGELLSELRSKIFAAGEHRCLPRRDLTNFYKKLDRPMDRDELSHIVSCGRCLDAINCLLGIPPLNERHPLDKIEKPNELDDLKPAIAKAAFAIAGYISFIQVFTNDLDIFCQINI